MTDIGATQYVDRGGVRLAYRLSGADGPAVPLLMIMGLAGVKEDWHELAPALARDRRVAVMDNRGIGGSDVPDGPYSIEVMARDALAVLDAAGWSRADVLGISMGGMIAQQLALLAPGRLRRLVLGCTTCGGAAQTPAEPEVLAAIQPKAGVDPLEAVREMMRVNFTPAWIEANPERFEILVRDRFRYRRRVKGIEAQMAAIGRFDLADAVTAIDVPTLVVHGTGDRLIPFVNGEALAARIPGARLEPLPEAGHLFWEMDQGRSAQLIRDFLAR